jgi:hypothetical protein
MLANAAIDVDALLTHWVPFIVGQRPKITVALDWTDFDADGQTTLMLSLLTRHGRATPLYCLTVEAPEPPLLLVLGRVAYDRVTDKLQEFFRELQTWRDVSLGADFPDTK